MQKKETPAEISKAAPAEEKKDEKTTKVKNPYNSGNPHQASNKQDDGKATKAICNGRNKGECEAGTLVQKKEGPAEITKPAEVKAEPVKVKDAKIETEEQKGNGIVKATNRNDDAPAKKPICNGRNKGECEAGTLVQQKAEHTKTEEPKKEVKEEAKP